MKKFYSVLFIGCMLALGLAKIASAQPTPVVHYNFNETSGTTAADISGNGDDGELNCDTCWTEDGYLAGALKFWGTEWVTLPGDDIGLNSTIGSVAFWMWSSPEQTSIYTMFSGGAAEAGGGFGADLEMHVHSERVEPDVWTGGELGFFIENIDADVHIFSDPDKGTSAGVTPVNPVLVNDETWHHIACTWAGGSVVLYIDGVKIMEKTDYDPAGFDLEFMFLGSMLDKSRLFIGMLDDFYLYDDVLSDLDIQDLMQSVDVEDHSAVRQGLELSNYPNPFNQTTTIRYQLAKDCDVSLTVYNQIGQKVRTLVHEKQGFGSQSITWDGSNDTGEELSSGIYVYRLQVDDKVQTRRLMLLR